MESKNQDDANIEVLRIEIAKLTLGPDDILVFQFPYYISSEKLDEMHRNLGRICAGLGIRKCMITSSGAKLFSVSKTEDDAQPR